MEIPMLKIRRSWDRLILNMGIPLLVRRHLYIETAPWNLSFPGFLIGSCPRCRAFNIIKHMNWTNVISFQEPEFAKIQSYPFCRTHASNNLVSVDGRCMDGPWYLLLFDLQRCRYISPAWLALDSLEWVTFGGSRHCKNNVCSVHNHSYSWPFIMSGGLLGAPFANKV